MCNWSPRVPNRQIDKQGKWPLSPAREVGDARPALKGRNGGPQGGGGVQPRPGTVGMAGAVPAKASVYGLGPVPGIGWGG